MKSIELENFRRFKKLENLEFSPITIFVGENNSGKSTVVKSILSINDFLRTQVKCSEDLIKPRFYFNKNYFAHIGTFERASYDNKNDTIKFSICTANKLINVYVENGPFENNNTYGCVSKIEIIDNYYCNTMTIIDFNTGLIDVFFKKEKTPFYGVCKQFQNDNFRGLKNDTVFQNIYKDLINYFDTIPSDFTIRLKLENFVNCCINNKDQYVSFIPLIKNDDFIYFFSIEVFNYIIHVTSNSEMIKAEDDVITIIQEHKDFLRANKVLSVLNLLGSMAENIEYIYSHSVTQNVVCSIKDRSDYYIQTINAYYEENIPHNSNDIIYSLICKWMKAFKIGDDYEFRNIAGEAIIVDIIKNGIHSNLADKGVGSIQLMVLLFRLGILVNKKIKNKNFVSQNTTILIEEPEQNLHPSLQSRLADLFYEIYTTYGFRFIIETHSEYLVRKSQVIVGDNFQSEEEMKKNPFKVYYFQSAGLPYNLEYELGGGFKDNFGDGFFNEATRLQKAIKQNKKKFDNV